jgi:hypothetical protein
VQRRKLKKKDVGKDEKWSEIQQKISSPPVNYILIALAILLLSYMFYDIFIHDPMPTRKTTKTEKPVASDSVSAVVDTPQKADVAEIPVSTKVPDDIMYTVKSGDTWGRIYTQFGVCSWFIRTYASNQGKFDSDDNPIAGSRITIPVIYSAKSSLNPDFYQEFSLEKTGTRCENANEDFVERFREANL